MQQPLHFTTQNAPLAEALAAVGFRLLAVWNKYTDGKLESLRCATVAEAKSLGKPGHLTWVFERAEDLDAAIEAYNLVGSALGKGELITSIERAEAIVIARAVMRGHVAFRELWKTQPAIYIQEDGTEAKTEGTHETGRVVTLPGFRAVSDNVSEADKNLIFKP